MRSYFAWLLLAIVSAIAPDCALGQTPATFTVSSNANGATFVDGIVPELNTTSNVLLIEYENIFGQTICDFAVVTSEETYSGLFENNSAFWATPFVAATIVDSSGSIAWSGMLVLNDTDDLGEDWVPLDPEDADNWNGCEDVALDIRSTLGCYAEIYVVTPNPPNPQLGPYRDVGQGWDEHHVVVKNGRVYDGFGPADGLPIDEYKDLWEYKDDINFGF